MQSVVNRARLVRFLVHWRTWTNAGTVVFSVWLLAVIAGVRLPGVPGSLFSLGMPISVALFFVGFACLARQQAKDAE